MHLSFFMKRMNVSGPAYGLGIVSFTTTHHGDLITVLVERYSVLLILGLKVFHTFRCIAGFYGINFDNVMILGNHNVSFGPPYVLVGISCKSKSGVSDRQRV